MGEPPRCSGGSDPALCCLPGTWDRLRERDPGAIYHYPEPLDEAIADVAAATGVDPHDLDHHVEGVHGWESHDVGYPDAVRAAAQCLLAGGCEDNSDR